MAAPSRAPRTRASGGRTLMLLGVLLALAAGTIVIYIVSTATGTTGQMVTVVVAKQNITSGTILTVGPTDPTHNTLSITDAFIAKQVGADFAPANYLPFTSQDQLNVKLNNQVVVGTYYVGDILRSDDFSQRLVALGSGPQGSYTNVNPARLPSNSVLMVLTLNGPSNGATATKTFAQPGDRIDLVVVACNLGPGAKDSGGCEAQTTMQDLYVYAVTQSQLILVVTHQQAVDLAYLQHVGNLEIVLRKPGDDGTISTNPADNSTIISEFHF